MGKFFREYGLIGILISVAVGGYFLLGEEREDILSSSLDALGTRLTELVDDREAKAETADSFEAFKEAVAANEIAPEDVERVAANVLNLSRSGAKLTPDEVRLVLDLSTEAEARALPSPGAASALPAVPAVPQEPETAASPSRAPRRTRGPWTQDAARRIGERVAAMVELTDKMKQAPDSQAAELGKHYHFVVNDGLHVVVDSADTPVWRTPEMRRLARDLERERVVVWDRNLEKDGQAYAEQVEAHRKLLEEARASTGVLPLAEAEKLQAIEQLNRLQKMGLIIKADTSIIRVQIDSILREALKDLEKNIESATGDGTVSVGGSSN